MKKSLLKRIFIYTGVLVIALFALMLLSVRFWLDDYYFSRQEDAIESAGAKIQEIYREDPEQLQESLSFYGENLGAGLFITTPAGQIIMSGNVSGSSAGGMMNGMMGGHGHLSRMEGFNGTDSADWLLYSTPLEDGNFLVARLAYAPIGRAVSVLTWFMALLSIPLLILAFWMIYMLSRSITRPLIQLNQVASRMKDLDFSAKYKGTEGDEIGQLGRTFNELTVRLEDTISRLSRELEKEKTMESMRKEFVARVSHEIRTPISVIRGYIEAMEEGLYEDESSRSGALNIITEESEKITKMTEDLLDLSQLESGHYRLNKRTMDFKELLEEVHEKFRINKKRTKESFPLELPEGPMWVMADGFRMEQVLNNLLNNAFVHAEPEGIIRIIAQREKGRIRVGVYNEGEPIPEKDIPYLWESFYKGEEKEKSKGVGLGLSIAKNILVLHEGQWGVKNREKGVEFFFSLPKIHPE